VKVQLNGGTYLLVLIFTWDRNEIIKLGEERRVIALFYVPD
jgi:hypothetical protein